MELALSLDLLLLLSGAVVSGLCAQLSLRAAFNDFRDGVTDDLAPFLDLGFSGNLNSAQYLSVGTDILLDLLLVLSVVVLPSNGISTSSLALEFSVLAICWGGKFIFSGISSSLLASCSSCLLVGVFISAGSSSLPSDSLSNSVSDSLGSGDFSGAGSGIRFAADALLHQPLFLILLVLEFFLVLVLGSDLLPTQLLLHLPPVVLAAFHLLVRLLLRNSLGIAAPGCCRWTELSRETLQMIGRGCPRCFPILLQCLSLRSLEELQGGLTRCCFGGPFPGDEFQKFGNEISQSLQHRVVWPEVKL